MEPEKFHMLLNMLKILERHEDRNVIDSALEIIEDCDNELTVEQKAVILKELLHMKVNDVEHEREVHFREESTLIRNDDSWF